MAESSLKILSPAGLKTVINYLNEDEEFRFARIKTAGKTGKLEIPAPTEKDEDNTDVVKSIRGSVLYIKKNFYRGPDADPEAEVSEKAEVYFLREGQDYPELFYVSPTSVKRLKTWVSSELKKGRAYRHVFIEIAGDVAENKKSSFKWTVVDFKTVRSLTDEEIDYVEALIPPVVDRVARYSTDPEAEANYEAALSGRELPVRPDTVSRANLREDLKNVEKEKEDETPARAEAPSAPEAEPAAEAPKSGAGGGSRRRPPSVDID